MKFIKLPATLLSFLIMTLSAKSALPEYLEHNGTFFEYKARIDNEKEMDSYRYKTLNDDNQRPYDVLTYDLFLDWYDAFASEPIVYRFTGYNAISLVLKENSASVDLDAKRLKIDSVISENIKLSFAEPINDILTVYFENNMLAGDTVSFTVYYTFTGEGNRGFYMFPKNMEVGNGPSGEMVYTEENIAYTMSQPNDARYWMPCNDTPSDKAVANISIRVPVGYTAVSNGLLSNIENDETASIFHWRDTSQIATYLMAATASVYAQYSEWYYPNENAEPIELVYYVWESDLDNEKTDYTVYNAKNAFRNTHNMIELYSDRFIPYPFAKYGQVVIQPFSFGGMEHQTISSINRSWLRGRTEAGIAHEVIHHWIGNLVTCENWKNIWFNEGGATWGEAVWAESWGGSEAYFNYMNSIGNQYRSRPVLHTVPIYDLPTNDIFRNPFNYIAYHKSSWVYHQLRVMLGDELFFDTFNDLLRKFAFGTMNLEQFQAHFEDAIDSPIVPFDVFFDQWLVKAGHPVFQISSTVVSKNEDEHILTVNLNQIQSGENIPDVFHCYVPIIAFNGDKSKELWAANTLANENFTFNLDFKPDSVRIDTRKVLAESNTEPVIVSVVSSDVADKSFKILPNILPKGNNFTIVIDNLEENCMIEIFDYLGNRIDTIFNDIASDGVLLQYSTSNLNSGQYFIRLSTNNFTNFQTIIIY